MPGFKSPWKSVATSAFPREWNAGSRLDRFRQADFGFTGVAGTAANIAKILFAIFLVL